MPMDHLVLIIEDEKGIADSIIFSLKQEGLNAHWVMTGKEAMVFVQSHNVDIVVLDIGLPDINGFDLLRQLRKKFDMPVIFLSARSEEIDRILGLELGADDYVTKPFSPRELMARIKANLRRMAKKENWEALANPLENAHTDIHKQPTLKKPLFVINENKFVVHFMDQKLPLSRYEFLILQLLLKHPGWIFDREKIMDKVWDDSSESFDRTVDTHIKTIRQKLKIIDSEQNPIITHRGIGYSIDESTEVKYISTENEKNISLFPRK